MRSKIQQAFTLVELLVVITIIAVLAALLLPVLSRSKIAARNIACLNNLKQLEACCHFYSSDNNDYLVPNNSVYILGGGSSSIAGISWLPDFDARTELDPSNIVNGLLFQYNTSPAIYHCPADQSTLEDTNGNSIGQSRWRSYNMSQSVNGYPDYSSFMLQYIPMWKKYTEIQNPNPSSLFVFIDENEDSILDAEFGNPPRGSPYFEQNVWWDLPSDRHNLGGNLSFADGHVEHWRWAARKIFIGYLQPAPPEEMPDYQRIQNAMKQPDD